MLKVFFKLILKIIVPLFPMKERVLAIAVKKLSAKNSKRLFTKFVEIGNIEAFLSIRKSDMREVNKDFLNYFFSSLSLLGFPSALTELREQIIEPTEHLNEHGKDFDSRIFSDNYFAPIGHTALIFYYLMADKLKIIPNKKNYIVGERSRFHCGSLFDTIKSTSGLMTISDAEFFEKHTLMFEDLLSTKLSTGELVSAVQLQFLTQKKLELSNANHFLSIDEELNERGKTFLIDNGYAEDSWFVALHVRNSPGTFRDARNAGLETYRKSIETITKAGGVVVRIGEHKEAKVFDASGLSYIDYEQQKGKMAAHTDLYTYFLSQCKFMIGTGSGPSAVPIIFGKPVVFTNWAPIGMMNGARNCLLLPKRMIYEQTGKEVDLITRVKDFGHIESNAGAKFHNVSYLDNTTQEINDAVSEMIGLIQNNKKFTHEFCSQEREFRKHLTHTKVYPVKLANCVLEPANSQK